MALLPTNFVDDVLDTSENTVRKYRKTDNNDSTVSFEDVTVYSTQGSQYGANEVNRQNAAINNKVTLGGQPVESINFVMAGSSLYITTTTSES